jgi:small subunit ribosomal protein S14
MAKKSMIAREAKRNKLVNKFAAKRRSLKEIIRDPNASYEDKETAHLKLQKLPRDSSSSRLRNRCTLTGRPHGFYRKFGLSRNKLREATMRGDVPGLSKASW